MTFNSPVVVLALGLSGLMFVACGSEMTPIAPTTQSFFH